VPAVAESGRLDPLSPPGSRLPDFPWDRLVPYAATARAHPDGICDLSVGTPVDPTPAVVQEALRAAADSPGYPTTLGTSALREAAAGWLVRRAGAGAVDPATEVLPCIGSKELVALLPLLLGVPPGSRLLFPELAYPTYDVGARLAGALPEPCADVTSADPAGVALVWLNSPANPSGQMLDAAALRSIVDWGREHGVPIVSDECYFEFGWEAESVSLLHPEVCGGSYEGLLVVQSLSKRSNLAGYRGGFVVGDAAHISTLLEIRKHLGLLVPGPVQVAMTAALADDAHVEVQRERYLRRRGVLRPALEAAGFRIDHSLGGLYLWATRGEACMQTVSWLAERGILVAPGDFYGVAGAEHVRIALTATDERVESAAGRLQL
jgi:succinyldiaminopimelate transaminase